MEKSLFDEIGGLDAIVAAVDLFYDKVQNDSSLAHFFEHLSIEKQSEKMIAFMAWAFGGPNEYKGRDLRTAHKQLVHKMDLDETHFDSIALHLNDTLKELSVPPHLIDKAINIVSQTKEEVLDR
jgi:hemoglobin